MTEGTKTKTEPNENSHEVTTYGIIFKIFPKNLTFSSNCSISAAKKNTSVAYWFLIYTQKMNKLVNRTHLYMPFHLQKQNTTENSINLCTHAMHSLIFLNVFLKLCKNQSRFIWAQEKILTSSIHGSYEIQQKQTLGIRCLNDKNFGNINQMPCLFLETIPRQI